MGEISILYPSEHYNMKYLSPVKFKSVSNLNHAVVKFVGLPLGVHVCVRLTKDAAERHPYREMGGPEKLT